MAGKQEGGDDDQQNPFEGLIDTGKRGADGHGLSLGLEIKSFAGKPRAYGVSVALAGDEFQ
jgi:hypothetical protein